METATGGGRSAFSLLELSWTDFPILQSCILCHHDRFPTVVYQPAVVLLLQLKAYALPPPFQCPLIPVTPLQVDWRQLPPGLPMVLGSFSEPAVSNKCL